MGKILTATELILHRFPGHNGIFVLKNIEEFMIEFAKLHVKEALKTALDETPYGSSTDTISYEDCVHILDCYPLENIK